jgi:hypothetical protein
MTTDDLQQRVEDRLYPQLFSEEEKQRLLKKAEELWGDLERNKLGGFSGINRPFLILGVFKEVIEEYGGRDVGLNWSYDALRAAKNPETLIKELKDKLELAERLLIITQKRISQLCNLAGEQERELNELKGIEI